MSAWSTAVLATSPYLFWRLGEASGSVAADASGNGRNGAYSSVTYAQASLVPSDATDSAILIDNAGDQVGASSGLSYSSTDFTAMVVLKGTGGSGGLFASGTSDRLTLNATISAVVNSSSVTLTPAYALTSLYDGNAHLVVWIVKAATAELWVDGVMVASAVHAVSPATRTSFLLKRPSSGPSTGTYDEVALWNRGLSSTEIASLHSAYVGGSTPTTVAGGQAPETDSGQAGSAKVGAVVAGGQAPETDTAQGGSTTVGAVVAGGQASESDTAQPGSVSSADVVGGGQAAETDTAQAGSTTVGTVVAGGRATETDTAQGGTVDMPGGTVPVDLATHIDLGGTAEWDGATLSGSPLIVMFPGLVLDPETTYTVEVDYAHNGSGFDGHASLHAVSDEAGSGSYGQLAIDEPLAGSGTATLTLGPGLEEWDTSVVGADEQFVAWQFYNLDITGIRVSPPMDGVAVGPDPIASDTDNDAHKLTLGGWGVATWEPAIVAASTTRVRHSVISAIAYGPVVMDGTRPVFTYSEADRPRLRQRILLAGRDVTYDRDVPTPDVEYELADLLLYGPGTLNLPAVMAAWEAGTAAVEGTREGRRVKVQLVDDFTDPENPTIEATVYRAFVMNPNVSGRFLTLELGGELQGRLALQDSKVLFRDELDISRMLWREVTDADGRYGPRLGEPGIGIKSLNFGGMGKLEKVEELLARAVKKDGTQRAVAPDNNGVYWPYEKDTETAHFSVFVDDAFTVPDLSSDIAEKPNRIYVTAIAPSGMRIDFAAVPGLIKTPAPDYPMEDDSAFGIGTTNEDTDTGDGVSVMVNRLGAVGLLDIRDTPGGFDQDAADALESLARRAKLTGPVGEMTPALWRALWDLDATGRDGRWSSIQPAAQHASVQRYLRSASGAVIGLNPDFDPDAVPVDESIDMGTGVRERQAENWAANRVHAPDDKVWYGTITVNLGAVLAGKVNVGATITSEDLVDARLVKPGLHNLWVPNFDGGTLFGVSGVQVNADSVTFTVDTRFRPAREIWERLQVRRETRKDPARRMLGTRQSTQQKDAVHGFLSWGGIVDRNVPLEPGWNVIEVPVGDHGTLAWIETVVQSVSGSGGAVAISGHEYALALFGKPITATRLNALVPAPLTVEGEKAWRRRATRKELRDHGFLAAFGTQDEPCGYGEDIKSDDAPLTGRFVDDAGVRYDVENYVARLAVWIGEGAADAKLLGGRVMWPVLEGGI